MLTPQEIEGQQFDVKRFGRGYDIQAVDIFLDEVFKDYSSLYKENAVLKSKLKALVEKIDEYRSVDESMRKALLVAKNMANDLVSGAKKQSEELTLSAKQEAERRILEYKAKTEQEIAKFNKIKEITASFADARISECIEELNKLKAIRDNNMSQEIPEDLKPAGADILSASQGQGSAESSALQNSAADNSEKTVKIESFDSISSLSKPSQDASQGSSVSDNAENVRPIFDYFETAGDKGVSAVPESDNSADGISNARIYNISLHNTKPNESFNLNENPGSNSEKPSDKFDNLHFGAAYNDIIE